MRSEFQFTEEVFFDVVDSNVVCEDYVKINAAVRTIRVADNYGCTKLNVRKKKYPRCLWREFRSK